MVDLKLVQLLFERQRAITVVVTRLTRDPVLPDIVFNDLFTLLCEGKLHLEGLPPQAITPYLIKAATHSFLAYVRKHPGKASVFDPQVIESLIDNMAAILEDGDQRLQALRFCLQPLRARQVSILLAYFGNGKSVKDLQAEGDLRQADTIYKEIGDLKRRLRECVKKRMEMESRSKR